MGCSCQSCSHCKTRDRDRALSAQSRTVSRGQPTPQSAAEFAAQSKQPKVPIRIGALLELPGILCTSAPNDHFHRVKADELSKVTGPTIAARLQAAGCSSSARATELAPAVGRQPCGASWEPISQTDSTVHVPVPSTYTPSRLIEQGDSGGLHFALHTHSCRAHSFGCI